MDAITDEFDRAIPEDEEPVDELAAPTLDIEIDVMFMKKRFEVLHLREPKAKEIERAERELATRDPTAHHFRKYQMQMIAAVAGVPIEVVGEIAASQLRKAWDFLARKLAIDTPPTGETSSPTSPGFGDGDLMTRGTSTARN